jgi:hypothetical protein
MTTFTLRLTAPLAQHVSSARMRSWITEFLRQPYALPLDPGPGEDRMSLTGCRLPLPSESVHALAGFLRCSPSEALRRLAAKAIGPSAAVTPDQRKLVSEDALWTAPQATARPRAVQPSPRSTTDAGNQLIGLIAQVLVMGLALLVWFFFSSRKERNHESLKTHAFSRHAVIFPSARFPCV